MTQGPNVRYSDVELAEFKTLIEGKIVKAEEELSFTHKQISELNENGFNQQGGDWYDDSTSHTDLEMLQRMATRQEQFIQNLRNALFRIQNKSYGVCTITGDLIPKARLMLVPHATKSIAGKTKSNERNTADGPDTMTRLKNKDGGSDSNGSPIEGKVRISSNGTRRPGASFDWDGPDQDTIENVGF